MSAAPSPPEPGDDAGAPPPPEGGPGDGGAEAGPSNPAGSIGDYSEKGLAFLDVSPVKPTSCGAFCTSKGGTCLPALAVQDSTAAAAGSAMYYAPSSSLQVPRLLATCAEVATETYLADVYAPYTPVLGSLTCSCTDVPVAPRVTVEAPVTVSCAAVCKSWMKTCEPARAWEIGFEPSGGIALYKTGDAASLGCADVPPASKSGSALDAVICACK